MKWIFILLLILFGYYTSQQTFYKRENYRYFETYSKINKKIVRIYLK